jgi:hypothetical protein
MADNKFLTAEEVSERYRGEITVGTLRNWRAMRIAPPSSRSERQFSIQLVGLMHGIKRIWSFVVRQGPAAWTNVREHDHPTRSRRTAPNRRPYAASLWRFLVNNDVTNLSHFFMPPRFSGM